MIANVATTISTPLGRARWLLETDERGTQAEVAVLDALVDALVSFADEDAWSMADYDVQRFGIAHGPWYFDSKDGSERPPWEVARQALNQRGAA